MNVMYAKHETASYQPVPPGSLIVIQEEQGTVQWLTRALSRALNTARPEIPGLQSLVPMAEDHLEQAGIHVVWIFDRRANLARALESGGGRRLYQLTATALREARMQVEGIEVNVHFDTEEDCLETNQGNWKSRLSLLHYPARQLEADAILREPRC